MSLEGLRSSWKLVACEGLEDKVGGRRILHSVSFLFEWFLAPGAICVSFVYTYSSYHLSAFLMQLPFVLFPHMLNSYFSKFCTGCKRAGPGLGYPLVTPPAPQPQPRIMGGAVWLGLRVGCRMAGSPQYLVSRVDQPSSSRIRLDSQDATLLHLVCHPQTGANDSSSRQHVEAKFYQCIGDMYY